eukprot:TRINITY_DN65233_c0_g1_i1.p1 TRINITY_DN65233_c0_g1~~TRINITY_DN65233_c0_g1_i1.p1  ORF type:complete len:322 (-),score=40.94 TRINITY_DN65233_c0_g1_i1:70-1035(-)
MDLSLIGVLQIWGACVALLLFWRYFLRPLIGRSSGLRALAADGGAAVVVTGCDSGFGRSVALRLHALGANVFAGCLTEKSCKELNDLKENSGRMRAFRLDVTKDEDVAAAVKRVEDSGLRLAAVINNAAISAFGWAEGLDVKTYQRNMDVNFFGIVRVTRGFLPALRRNRGRLVNMGSIGARMPSAFGSAYLSTKAAMCSYSDCVRQEMHRFGVSVALVEPGFFATSLLANGASDGGKLSVDPNGYPAYADKMQRTAEPIRQMERINGHDCEWVIGAVVDAIVNRWPLARYTVGWDARLIRHFVIPCVPAWVVDMMQTLQD